MRLPQWLLVQGKKGGAFQRIHDLLGLAGQKNTNQLGDVGSLPSRMKERKRHLQAVDDVLFFGELSDFQKA
jgi:hypothetical protein